MTCTGSIYKHVPFSIPRTLCGMLFVPTSPSALCECHAGLDLTLYLDLDTICFSLEFLWNISVCQSKNLEEMSHKMCRRESEGHREWHFARGNWGASRFLKVLSTLSEDQWLIPRIHTRQLNYSVTPAQGVLSPSSCAHKYLHIYTRRHTNK